MKEELDKKLTQKTYFELKMRSDHDLILAVILASATFHGFSFWLFIFPFLWFLISLIFTKKIPKDIEKEIRSQYPIPKRILLRVSKVRDCQMFSVPFCSILYLTKDVYTDLQSEVTEAKIYHELGHIGQYDRAVYYMLLYPAFFNLAGLFYGLPDAITRISSYYQEHGHLKSYAALIFFPQLVLLHSLIALLLYRVFHRREFLADTSAALIKPNAMVRFLKRGIRRDKHKKPKNLWHKIKDRLTHPSFQSRLDVQKNGINIGWKKTFAFYFFWSFSIALLFIFMIVLTKSDHPFHTIPYYKKSQVALMFILIAILVGFIGYQIQSVFNQKEHLASSAIPFVVTTSYFFGFTCCYIFMFRGIGYLENSQDIMFSGVQYIGMSMLSLIYWLVPLATYCSVTPGKKRGPVIASLLLFALAIFITAFGLHTPLGIGILGTVWTYSAILSAFFIFRKLKKIWIEKVK